MNIAIVIPSRYDSKRFKGKPLAIINGKTMIQRVYERCKESKINNVIVATDDERIFNEVKSFGGDVVMTSREHNSGTERIYEVMENNNFDWVINVQGDEPLISPELIKNIYEEVLLNKSQVISAVRKNHCYDDFNNKNIVKVTLDKDNNALYFSRSPIPFELKDGFDFFYHHIGIYAYSKDAINLYVNSKSTELEKTEKLEQLRFLFYGIKVRMIITDYVSIGVDTKEDIKKIEEILRKNEEN